MADNPPIKKNAFVHKLYSMLNDPKLSHLIWWNEHTELKNTFSLLPGKEFSNILTNYFKHGNVASFVRQLHMYGFHKVNDNNSDNQIWEFKHSSGKFRKDDEESLIYIKRRSNSNTNKSSSTTNNNDYHHQSVFYSQPYYGPPGPYYYGDLHPPHAPVGHPVHPPSVPHPHAFIHPMAYHPIPAQPHQSGFPHQFHQYHLQQPPPPPAPPPAVSDSRSNSNITSISNSGSHSGSHPGSHSGSVAGPAGSDNSTSPSMQHPIPVPMQPMLVDNRSRQLSGTPQMAGGAHHFPPPPPPPPMPLHSHALSQPMPIVHRSSQTSPTSMIHRPPSDNSLGTFDRNKHRPSQTSPTTIVERQSPEGSSHLPSQPLGPTPQPSAQVQQYNPLQFRKIWDDNQQKSKQRNPSLLYDPLAPAPLENIESKPSTNSAATPKAHSIPRPQSLPRSHSYKSDFPRSVPHSSSFSSDKVLVDKFPSDKFRASLIEIYKKHDSISTNNSIFSNNSSISSVSSQRDNSFASFGSISMGANDKIKSLTPPPPTNIDNNKASPILRCYSSNNVPLNRVSVNSLLGADDKVTHEIKDIKEEIVEDDSEFKRRKFS